ncbi:MAG: acyl-CoA dehydrogenase family protein [Aeromicrobium sp.]
MGDVYVRATHLVGSEDGGFKVLLDGEAVGKIRVSAIKVGIAQRALDEAATCAVTRMHRDAAIGDKFSSIQSLLADMQASVVAPRSLLVERLCQEAKSYEVAQGSVDLQRVIVGPSVLRSARRPSARPHPCTCRFRTGGPNEQEVVHHAESP